VPGDAFAELEGDALAIGRGFPTLGENANGLAVAVQIDKVFLNFSTNNVDTGRGLNAGIKLALFGSIVDVEHTAFARRLLCKSPHRFDDIRRDSSGHHESGTAIDLQACKFHRNSPQHTRYPILPLGPRAHIGERYDTNVERVFSK